MLFEDIVNSVKDPIFQPIPETKKTYENRSIYMQRKIYRGHRKTLSVTIHGQIMDRLKETAAKKQMTISAVTDEMLYRGLVDAGLMEE